MLDPTYVANLRTGVEYRVEAQYLRAAQNLKFQRFTRIVPTNTLIQLYSHMITDPLIEDYGEMGGGVRFEDIVLGIQEWRNHYSKTGLSLPVSVMNDLQRNRGINIAAEWATKLGAAWAYWPQRRSIKVLQNGIYSSMITENGNVIKLTCYDGLPLFTSDNANPHPYNFKRASLGGFVNLYKGAPDYTVDGVPQPGFLPVAGPFKKDSSTGEWKYDAGSSVSAEDGLQNLIDAVVAIRSVKMADGITPRFLAPTGIIAGAKLQFPLSKILDAKFIAASSTGGGGTQDIQGTLIRLGMSEPIILDELMGQTDPGIYEDYSYYLICEPNIAVSNFGAITFGVLEPFSLYMYSAVSGSAGVDYDLAVANEVRWVSQGRNLCGVGLPEFIFKSQAPVPAA